ncbi:MAG: ABC transporter substrate-binding protein [Phaeobacter gallaeciensis]
MTAHKSFFRGALAGVILATGGLLPAALEAQTLRAVPHAQLESLDPIWTTAYITRTHGYLVYDTLFGFDESFTPQPQMVDTWSVSEDGLEWNFTLRPGMKWHDGAPVTARDCVASLRRWGARDGVGQILFSKINTIEATADDTFAITLETPYPAMEATLAQMSANVPFMMPARIAETDPAVPITDPTGSGPFKFAKDEWIPGERVVYVRNDDYVPREEPTSLAAGAKTPFLERIEWVSYPDQAQAVQALIDNEVQYLESPTTQHAAELEGIEGISVVLADAVGSIGMGVFNHQIAPFNDVDVRLAAITAMDQADYMEAAIGVPEYWRVCPSVYPCGTEFSKPVADSAFTKGDVDKAREMLAATSYDGTPIVVMDPVDSPVISAFTDVSVAALESAGFAIERQEMKWSELVLRRVNRTEADGETWNMFHTWWLATDLMEPSRIAFSGDPDTGWIGWPTDESLQSLRAEYAVAEDETERARLADAIQARIVEQGNFAILGQFFEPIAFRDSVVGLQRPIQMYYNLAVFEKE